MLKGALCKLQFAEGKFSSGHEKNPDEARSDVAGDDALAASVAQEEKMPLLSRSLSLSEEMFDTGDVNANSTRDGLLPTRPLCEALTADGHFAYFGLLTEALSLLFTDIPIDKAFAGITLKRFSTHINVSESTIMAMEMRLRGEIDPCGWKNFVALLKDEVTLRDSFIPLVQDLVIFAVQGGSYDARIRVLINHISCQLCVGSDVVEMFEESVLEYLAHGQMNTSEEEIEKENRNLRKARIRRYALISIATIGGGALLGLTGGLAAPFIGAGLGSIIGAGGAAALASTTGMAVIGSLFGAAGAGLTGFKMKKRIGEVEEFSFEFLTEGSSLHITIALSGWLTEESPDAFKEPWQTLYHSREQYCLRYESKYLLELGKAMTLLLQFAVSVAVQESLKYTILAGIISAVTWPTSLLTLAAVIDNPWGVCIRRSAEAGRQLAQVLYQRYHGRRPVTLIGFSLGARVIYYCLQELLKKEDSAGIVQDAILLGAPVPGYANDWKKMVNVVSGRIINGYCQTDWLLRFLYRTSSASLKIAGLEKVEWEDRRMFNFNLTDIVEGHNDYSNKLDAILKTLGIRTQAPKENIFKNDLRKSYSHTPTHSSSSWLFKRREMRRYASDTELLMPQEIDQDALVKCDADPQSEISEGRRTSRSKLQP